MLKHGLTLLFTLMLSISLAGCFGGNGSSKADTDSGDRSSETGDSPEQSLDITDAFSVDAGVNIQTDAGAKFELTGRISRPDSVTIAESYWRTFTAAEGFQRIETSLLQSDADNVHLFTAGRFLEKRLFVYQFVAVDTQGRAAVDTIYIDVNPDTPSLSASLRSESVAEGDTIALALTLNEALDDDLVLNFVLENGTATVGEDVADCGSCTLTIPAGETTALFSLETLTDELEEGRESFFLTLTEYAEALGENARVELLIDDSQGPVLSIVSFSDTVLDVTEKSGEIRIPLIVQEPYSYIPPVLDSVNTKSFAAVSSEELQQAEAIAILSVVTLGYQGNATGGADYAESDGVIYYDDDANPYLLLRILDDVESEGPETLRLSLLAGQGYEQGEVTDISITIRSDDVRLMASATDAYCTVEDHQDIRCWGDFRDGKTATPPMGSIEKLVGASDYFCAIHEDDGARRLSCWGNVPGGFRGERDAPEDIVALDDYWCELSAGTVNCYGDEFSPVTADAMAGAHQGLCYIGEGAQCPAELELPDRVTSLVTPGSQFLHDWAIVGDGNEFAVACARSFNEELQVHQAACDGVDLPESLTNPVAMAAVNLDNELYVCLIDETAEGNALVCVNSGGQAVPLFSDLNIVDPYGLTSDFDTHLCVSHLNGVDCVEWDGVAGFVPLISLTTAPVTAVSGGAPLGAFGFGSALCGLQGGIVNCLQPGQNQSPVSLQSPDEGSVTALDFEHNMPAVVTDAGNLYFYQDFGQGVNPSLVDLDSPVTSGDLIAKGNGFVCYQVQGNVSCLDYFQSGVSSPAGTSVAGASDLAAGNNQACALVDNRMLCWNSGEPSVPLALAEVTADIIAMDYAGYSGCAVTAGNELHCWGYITEYLGSGDPLAVNVGAVQSVATANARVCVQGDQGVQCWGRGGNGVEINADAITDLTVTDDFACMLENSKVRCWGGYAERIVEVADLR